MTDPKTDLSSTDSDLDQGISGDEPMTGAQASYLQALAEQAHEPFEYRKNLTKAEASKLIDVLRRKTGIAGE
jgi:DUF3072 family protein